MQFLIDNGWELFHTCGCSGKPHSYKHDRYAGYIIKILTSKNEFRIIRGKRNDKAIHGGPNKYLESAYNEVFKQDTAAI